MPTVASTRTIAASTSEVWEVVGDPHHLPRWWPRVTRVEDVRADAFTEVLLSDKGKLVRADFDLLDAETGRRLVWSQQIEGTPFGRVLASAEREIELVERGAGTEVTIELRQTLHGVLARLGSRLVKRAADATVEQALDGLERVFGDVR